MSIVMAFFIFVMFIIGASYILYIAKHIDTKDDDFDISSDKSMAYVDFVNELCDLVVTYKFQEYTGKKLNINIGAIGDISNDETYQLVEICENEVNKYLNGDIKAYLINLFGQEWLNYRIHLQVLGLVLNKIDKM